MKRIAAAAALLALAAGSASAQKPIPAAEGISKAEAFIAEGKVAPEQFKQATEAIKKGNEALTKGEQDNAYCLFEEGILRLNTLKEVYPDWEKDAVMQQIRNTLEVKNKLEAAQCKELEAMKEAHYRFKMWQRQVVVLKKLDELLEIVKKMERIQDKNDRYIKDIRDRLTGSR